MPVHSASSVHDGSSQSRVDDSKRRLLAAFLTAAFAFVLLAPSAFAITRTVCAIGCDFTSIQAAIDDAGTSAGDVISVQVGTYTEQINVTKILNITGASPTNTFIVGGFNVTANATNITSFNISQGYVWDPDGAGTGGIFKAGIWTNSSNNIFYNNVVRDILGGSGDNVGSGTAGDGGNVSAVYMSSSSGNNVSSNTISNLTGGVGGTAGSGIGGAGGNVSVIFMYSSDNDKIISNTISNVSGGAGGTGSGAKGGRGGYASAIFLGSSANTILSSNTISNLTGGRGGTTGSSEPGGDGGAILAIYLNSADNSTIYSNTISNATAGDGRASTSNVGGGGGNVSVISLLSSNNTNLSSNTVSNVIAGRGGSTGSPASGGGGAAFVVNLISARNNTIASNTFVNVTGGNGGTVSSGFAQKGGNVSAIYISSSDNSTIAFNVISNLTGGDRETTSSSGSGGGNVSAIHTLSSNNTNITSNNVSNLRGGSIGSGGTASGSLAFGIYADSSINKTIASNTLHNITGGPGGAAVSGSGGNGSVGGNASAIYLTSSRSSNISLNNVTKVNGGVGGASDSGGSTYGGMGGVGSAVFVNFSLNNSITYNNITDINGGMGGVRIGGLLGGFGGIASAVFMLNSNNTQVTANTVSSVMAGTGGGGNVGEEGHGGATAAVYLSTSSGNNVSSNNFTNITGGPGGNFADPNGRGTGGNVSAIFLTSSNNNTLRSNTILNVTGGVSSLGSGGNASAIFLNSSTSNDVLFNSISNVRAGSGGATNSFAFKILPAPIFNVSPTISPFDRANASYNITWNIDNLNNYGDFGIFAGATNGTATTSINATAYRSVNCSGPNCYYLWDTSAVARGRNFLRINESNDANFSSSYPLYLVNDTVISGTTTSTLSNAAETRGGSIIVKNSGVLILDSSNVTLGGPTFDEDILNITVQDNGRLIFNSSRINATNVTRMRLFNSSNLIAFNRSNINLTEIRSSGSSQVINITDSNINTTLNITSSNTVDIHNSTIADLNAAYGLIFINASGYINITFSTLNSSYSRTSTQSSLITQGSGAPPILIASSALYAHGNAIPAANDGRWNISAAGQVNVSNSTLTAHGVFGGSSCDIESGHGHLLIRASDINIFSNSSLDGSGGQCTNSGTFGGTAETFLVATSLLNISNSTIIGRGGTSATGQDRLIGNVTLVANNISVLGSRVNGFGGTVTGGAPSNGTVTFISNATEIVNSVINGTGGLGPSGGNQGKGTVSISAAAGYVKIDNSTLDGWGASGAGACTGGRGNIIVTSSTDINVSNSTLNGYGGTCAGVPGSGRLFLNQGTAATGINISSSTIDGSGGPGNITIGSAGNISMRGSTLYGYGNSGQLGNIVMVASGINISDSSANANGGAAISTTSGKAGNISINASYLSISNTTMTANGGVSSSFGNPDANAGKGFFSALTNTTIITDSSISAAGGASLDGLGIPGESGFLRIFAAESANITRSNLSGKGGDGSTGFPLRNGGSGNLSVDSNQTFIVQSNLYGHGGIFYSTGYAGNNRGQIKVRGSQSLTINSSTLTGYGSHFGGEANLSSDGPLIIDSSTIDAHTSKDGGAGTVYGFLNLTATTIFINNSNLSSYSTTTFGFGQATLISGNLNVFDYSTDAPPPTIVGTTIAVNTTQSRLNYTTLADGTTDRATSSITDFIGDYVLDVDFQVGNFGGGDVATAADGSNGVFGIGLGDTDSTLSTSTNAEYLLVRPEGGTQPVALRLATKRGASFSAAGNKIDITGFAGNTVYARLNRTGTALKIRVYNTAADRSSETNAVSTLDHIIQTTPVKYNRLAHLSSLEDWGTHNSADGYVDNLTLRVVTGINISSSTLDGRGSPGNVTIISTGNVSITNSTLTGSGTAGTAAAGNFLLTASSANITNSTLSGAGSDGLGGSVGTLLLNLSGDLNVRNSTLQGYGGTASPSLCCCHVAEGVMSINASNINVSLSTLDAHGGNGNQGEFGQAILNATNYINISDSRVSANGGTSCDTNSPSRGNLTLAAAAVVLNNATLHADGGGRAAGAVLIRANGSTTVINNSIINSTGGSTGNITIIDAGNVTIINSTLKSYGAISNANGSFSLAAANVTVTNSTIDTKGFDAAGIGSTQSGGSGTFAANVTAFSASNTRINASGGGGGCNIASSSSGTNSGSGRFLLNSSGPVSITDSIIQALGRQGLDGNSIFNRGRPGLVAINSTFAFVSNSTIDGSSKDRNASCKQDGFTGINEVFTEGNGSARINATRLLTILNSVVAGEGMGFYARGGMGTGSVELTSPNITIFGSKISGRGGNCGAITDTCNIGNPPGNGSARIIANKTRIFNSVIDGRGGDVLLAGRDKFHANSSLNITSPLGMIAQDVVFGVNKRNSSNFSEPNATLNISFNASLTNITVLGHGISENLTITGTNVNVSWWVVANTSKATHTGVVVQINNSNISVYNLSSGALVDQALTGVTPIMAANLTPATADVGGAGAIDRPYSSQDDMATYVDNSSYSRIAQNTTIVAWSAHLVSRGGYPPMPLKLKIFRSNGTHFLLVGESEPKHYPAVGLNNFTDIQIDVKEGDYIGFYKGGGVVLDANAGSSSYSLSSLDVNAGVIAEATTSTIGNFSIDVFGPNMRPIAGIAKIKVFSTQLNDTKTYHVPSDPGQNFSVNASHATEKFATNSTTISTNFTYWNDSSNKYVNFTVLDKINSTIAIRDQIDTSPDTIVDIDAQPTIIFGNATYETDQANVVAATVGITSSPSASCAVLNNVLNAAWNASCNFTSLGNYTVTVNFTDSVNIPGNVSETVQVKDLNFSINASSVVFERLNSTITGIIFREPEHVIVTNATINITYLNGSGPSGTATNSSGNFSFNYTAPSINNSIINDTINLNATDGDGIAENTSFSIKVYPFLNATTFSDRVFYNKENATVGTIIRDNETNSNVSNVIAKARVFSPAITTDSINSSAGIRNSTTVDNASIAYLTTFKDSFNRADGAFVAPWFVPSNATLTGNYSVYANRSLANTSIQTAAWAPLVLSTMFAPNYTVQSVVSHYGNGSGAYGGGLIVAEDTSNYYGVAMSAYYDNITVIRINKSDWQVLAFVTNNTTAIAFQENYTMRVKVNGSTITVDWFNNTWNRNLLVYNNAQPFTLTRPGLTVFRSEFFWDQFKVWPGIGFDPEAIEFVSEVYTGSATKDKSGANMADADPATQARYFFPSAAGGQQGTATYTFNVTTPQTWDSINLTFRWDSNTAHNTEAQIFNYSSGGWISFGSIVTSGTQTYNRNVTAAPANFSAGGKVLVRIFSGLLGELTSTGGIQFAWASLGDIVFIFNSSNVLTNVSGTTTNLTGSLTSAAVTPSDLLSWKNASVNVTVPTNTTLAIDVLNAADNSTLNTSAASTGANTFDISSINASAYPSLRLRARMSTTNMSTSPILSGWNISYLAISQLQTGATNEPFLNESGRTFFEGVHNGSLNLTQLTANTNHRIKITAEPDFDLPLFPATGKQIFINPFALGARTLRAVTPITIAQDNFSISNTVIVEATPIDYAGNTLFNSAPNASIFNATGALVTAINLTDTYDGATNAVYHGEFVVPSTSGSGYWTARLTANQSTNLSFRDHIFFINYPQFDDNASDTKIWHYRVRVTLDNTFGPARTNVPVVMTGTEINYSFNASTVTLPTTLNSTRVVDPDQGLLTAGLALPIQVVNGGDLDYLDAADEIRFYANISENSNKTYYVYISADTTIPVGNVTTVTVTPAAFPKVLSPVETAGMSILAVQTDKLVYGRGEQVNVTAFMFAPNPSNTFVTASLQRPSGSSFAMLLPTATCRPTTQIFPCSWLYNITSSETEFGVWSETVTANDPITIPAVTSTRSNVFLMQEVQVRVSASSASLNIYDSVNITGNLTWGSNGTAIASQNLTLNLTGPKNFTFNLTTNSTGGFNVTFTPDASGEYNASANATLILDVSGQNGTAIGFAYTTFRARLLIGAIPFTNATTYRANQTALLLVNLSNRANSSVTVNLDFNVSSPNFTFPSPVLSGVALTAFENKTVNTTLAIGRATPVNYTVNVSVREQGDTNPAPVATNVTNFTINNTIAASVSIRTDASVYGRNTIVNVTGFLNNTGNLNISGNLQVDLFGPEINTAAGIPPGGIVGFGPLYIVNTGNFSDSYFFTRTWNTTNDYGGTYNVTARFAWNNESGAPTESNSSATFSLTVVKDVFVDIEAPFPDAQFDSTENMQVNFTLRNRGNTNVAGNFSVYVIDTLGRQSHNFTLNTSSGTIVRGASSAKFTYSKLLNDPSELWAADKYNVTITYLFEGTTVVNSVNVTVLATESLTVLSRLTADRSPANYSANENATFTILLRNTGNIIYSNALALLEAKDNSGTTIANASSLFNLSLLTTNTTSLVLNMGKQAPGNYTAVFSVWNPYPTHFVTLSNDDTNRTAAFNITPTRDAKVRITTDKSTYDASDPLVVVAFNVDNIGNVLISGNINLSFYDVNGVLRDTQNITGVSVLVGSAVSSTLFYNISSRTTISPGTPLPNSSYNLTATYFFDGKTSVNSTRFQVGKMVVSVSTDKTIYLPGDTVNATVNASLFGSALTTLGASNFNISLLRQGTGTSSNLAPTISNLGGGIYYFTFTAGVIDSYTLTVNVTDPTTGIRGSGTASFNIEEHFLKVSLASSSLGTAVQDTEDKYVAAPASSVAALVFRGSTFNSLSAETGKISLTQRVDNSKAYLVFTSGDAGTIESRMPLIRDNSFEAFSNPSFAFSLTKKLRVTVGIQNPDVDVLTDSNATERLRAGTYEIIVKNSGFANNKTQLLITKR